MIQRALTDDDRARLHELEHDGKLTPRAVFDEARREDSVLHTLYNWDMAAAAESHWLDVSREIIRKVKMVVTTETIQLKAPAYIRDPDALHSEQGYISVVALRQRPEAAREALVAEFTRAAGNLRRALGVAAVLGLQADVEEMLTRVMGLREGLLSTPPPSVSEGDTAH